LYAIILKFKKLQHILKKTIFAAKNEDMLKSLSIENYALIDKLDIAFSPGFSTITGETGAGKSILLGALSLILGNRAELSVLKNKEEKCIIEGVFDISKLKLQQYFKENLEDVDYDSETILRRIITPSGKSRAFVNDAPVSLNALREIGLMLIDIHSQHKNLLLSDNKFQLNVVDSMAQNEKILQEYKLEFKSLKEIQNTLNQLIEKAKTQKNDADYFQHRFEQLAEAKLVENEQETLERELETMNNAEEIKLYITRASQILNGEEHSILSGLSMANEGLKRISKVFPKIDNFIERLASALIEIQDISTEIEVLSEDVEFNQDRLNFINERLDLLYSLQQMHRVNSVTDLLKIQSELEEKLNEIQNFDFEIADLTKKMNLQKEKVEKLASLLSENRKKISPKIEKSIVSQLISLGMPSAVFKIQLERESDYTSSGFDTISYLFSANKSSELSDITKVASGGEIARVMISIKSLVSANMALPTIIFDEIDTGVSGDIADKMGNIMAEMSKNMQVLSITHLPQIAAKGKKQYLVYKKDTKDSTISNIKELSEKERVTEIAKMLSGKDLSDAAIENAKHLLQMA